MASYWSIRVTMVYGLWFMVYGLVVNMVYGVLVNMVNMVNMVYGDIDESIWFMEF